MEVLGGDSIEVKGILGIVVFNIAPATKNDTNRAKYTPAIIFIFILIAKDADVNDSFPFINNDISEICAILR